MNSNNEYLEFILESIDLLKVCEKLGMNINKKGNQRICLCPFHEDHHPSLNLYNESNQYHCFSCGNHGNIFSLIKGVKDYNFQETISWIENEFPEVLEKKPKLRKTIDNKGTITTDPYELAYETYKDMTEDEKRHLEKFSLTRMYNLDFFNRAEVFYSNKDKLKRKFYEENIEARNELESVQLIKKLAVFSKPTNNRFESSYRDYFQNRAIITLRDYHNKIIGFSGRTLDEKEKPKYLFTKNLNKGSFLYRLNNVRNSVLRDQNKKEYVDLYLVEGIFDVLRLEGLGLSAVGVLGSHLTVNQSEVLGQFIDDIEIPVSIHIFMDSDAAGIKGAFTTLKNILNSDIALKCKCDVVIIKKNNENLKDADEFLRYNLIDEIEKNSIDIFDFLFKYFSPDNDITEYRNSIDIYNNMKSDEKKIVLLNNINNILPRDKWDGILNWYGAIFGLPDNHHSSNDDNYYAFNIIKKYLLRDINDGYNLQVKNKSFISSMQNAVEIARSSYKKEIVSLDDYTWDRILMGADAFYEYFSNCLIEGEHLKVPLLTMNFPKSKVDNRKKSIYIHEQLIMQQYILNELLGRDRKKEYERCIPAVRYNPDENETMYTTGMNYYEFFNDSCDKVVSFAYQINTKAVNGDAISNNGMFRPFYECWKSYISFIQDGINKLNSETVYRVKFDIKGYYDYISNITIRNVLSDTVTKAIKYADNRFKDIAWSEDGNKIVEWIIDELYDYKYYNPMDGKITERDNALIGIPQGPNLSAYIANVVLFNLDKLVMEYVNKINNEFKAKITDNSKEKIIVRYARYVDDMVVITTNPQCIVHIKEIIKSELYRLGLSLSEKTDEADAISKEDAIEWTVSEKGGLGVSSVFDFIDDDDINTIIDNNYDWNIVDRRSALKILSNMMLNASLDDNTLESKEKFNNISEIFFKTEEIRFNDIVRFSQLMLCSIFDNSQVEDEKSILKAYKERWEELIKVSPNDSLFKREKIYVLSFLEACIQLLMKEVPLNTTVYEESYVQKAQKRLMINILKYNIVEEINCLLGNQLEDIVSINREFLKIKLLSLKYLINKRLPESLHRHDEDEYKKIKGDNEYFIRWEYCYKESTTKNMTIEQYKLYHYKPLEKQMLNYFHYLLSNMINIESFKEYNTVINKVIEEAKEFIFPNKDKNILANCISIWASLENTYGNNEKAYDENIIKISLDVMINFISNSLLAEIISNNNILKNYIFENKIEKYLPVFPGMRYPGILGVDNKNNETSELLVERIEFKSNDEEINIQPKENWEQLDVKNSNPNIDKFQYLYKKNVKSLSDFFSENKSYDVYIKEIAEIYDALYKKIQEIQENDYVCVLSKENIFINEQEVKLENKLICFGYYFRTENCNYAVAIQEGKGAYKLQSINENGNEFWQAGFILKDAFEWDKRKLAALEFQDPEEKEALVLLDYSFRRLTGKTININFKQRSNRSYTKSIERTINTMISFIKYKENRDIYVLDCILLDSYISYRMKQSSYDYNIGEIEYFLSLWAEGCINANFANLYRIIKKKEININQEALRKSYTMRRVVAINYLLSLHINNMYVNERNEKFSGMELLSKGLMCSAISLNLKMQVFEQIELLDDNQRKALKDRELPYDLFGFNDRIILVIGENSKERLKGIIDDILDGKFRKEINYITPLGWILVLGYILEIDDVESYIRGKSVNQSEAKNEMLALKDLLAYVLDENEGDDTEHNANEFPLEQLKAFNDLWNYNNFLKIYGKLENIDKYTRTEVMLKSSEFFNTSFSKNIVSITLEDMALKKSKYFVTHGSIVNHNISIEGNSRGKKSFTQSVNDEKIIGISYVEEYLSKIVLNDDINNIINDEFEQEKISESSIEDKTINEKGKSVIEKTEDETTVNNTEGTNTELNIDKPETVAGEKDGGSICNIEETDNVKTTYSDEKKQSNNLNELIKRRNDNWEKRKKEFTRKDGINYSFENVDRIALFQFNIDNSSYEHPENEKCPKTELCAKSKICVKCGKCDNSDKCKVCPKCENYLESDEHQECECVYEEKDKYSAVEFRRRKLLSPVLEACEKFGVEILLLPEYSVRPETIEWLYRKMKEEEYNFSIWAGTFKITPGYDFSKLNTLKSDLDKEFYYRCSAVLPIILNKNPKGFGEKLNDIQVIANRFKKYPSIALDEVINTVPAKEKQFKPVMKTKFKQTLFGDARDDVTELICAELFLIASPSNYVSFMKKSYDMYCKFSTEGKIDFKDYSKTVVDDIITFGEYISFYQVNNKYYRTPIILVPACTTRTVDYYVNAQANYLASGITTVLCNSAGNDSKGGSCFIGQNSWDDYKLTKKNNCSDNVDYLPKNTIYHGLQPGIYQQASSNENRGALGLKEQALLICDINPDVTFKGKPNPESMMDSLSIVAHIPIIEDDIFVDKCGDCNRQCFKKPAKEKLRQQSKNFVKLQDLQDHILKYETKFLTTIDDENPEKIKDILKELSEHSNSDWLKKRGEIYAEQHKNNPLKWPTPAFLDWIYVVVDYDEFFRDVKNVKEKKQEGIPSSSYIDIDYEIQMPSFNNKQM